MKKHIILILVILALLISIPVESKSYESRGRDQLKKDFDVVAQNLGAIEFAFYTFTLEFEKPPENMADLVKSGHIMCDMLNPYTGEKAHLGELGEKPQAGGTYYRKNDTDWGELECWYVHPNKPSTMRSMNVQMKKFTHEEMKKMAFNPDLAREEQMTIVYLIQLDDAIETFNQKIGRMPVSLDEMSKIGDVNVSYINPFTGKPVKDSRELSPGDYMFRTFESSGEEQYEVVGWGKTEPVYYYCTDDSKESFEWKDSGKVSNSNGKIDEEKED
jgi:hypothetical protein